MISAVISGIQDVDYQVAKTACNFLLEYLAEDNNEDEDFDERMKIL